MGSSKFHIEESRETRIVDEQEWNSSWLRDADHEECNQDGNNVGDVGAVGVVTPQRRSPQILSYDEVSPTTTNFSLGSVFDVPEGFGDSWIEEDPFCDDVSGVISILDCEAKVVRDSRETLQQEDLGDNFKVRSFASFDLPSEVEEGLANSINTTCRAHVDIAALLIDRDGPRITWITSCTQCILADLPCSRTTPCCSRCKRNGQANVCLLHRRKFREEVDSSEAEAYTTLVLLKLQGEDESHWREKLRLAREVHL
ncbi:hypothetical protein N0V95_003609 [Ascochyta clinopodiicola]|nr:hypothetical protein N0V95_003609 [Ascochyta clinopodiicola]